MSVLLKCDLCLKSIKNLNEISVIANEYQVAERIVHICIKCSKFVNKRIASLSNYYSRQIANDMRLWLLDLRAENSRKN